MKILFLNPPFMPMFSRSSRSPAVAKSSTLYYPIFLSYAAGYAEKEGHKIYLLDAVAKEFSQEQTYKFAEEFKPELIIVDTSTPSIFSDIEIAEELKKRTGAFVILVGTHVSGTVDETLNRLKNVDGIAVHEYDETIAELASKLDKLGFKPNLNISIEKLKNINGLVLKDKDGKIIKTRIRPYIEDLDKIPWVSKLYKRFFYEHLEKYFYGANRHPVVTILSGRGCPYQCAYCVYPQTLTGHKYRLRSIKDVVDELEYIKKEFPHVKEIFLEDDTLTVNRKRAVELSKEIIRRKLKIVWSTNSRADADYETLKWIKKAGCRLLCVGFESGDQKILDNIGKNLKIEQIEEFSKAVQKAGILVHGCYLVGNKGETKETLEKTLKLAKKIHADTAQFYPIMVYPGTKAYNWAKEKGYLLTENYNEWLTEQGLHNSVVSTPELTKEELVAWCDNARREFYLRPSYLFGKLLQILKHPSEFGRIFRGGTTLLGYMFHLKK